MAAGRIFCIMGKSASGKDSLYRAVLERQPVPLKSITTYTTRPIRNNEQEGVEYHFSTIEKFQEMREQGLVIESRCYHTVFGDWFYFTADDGQIDLTPMNPDFPTETRDPDSFEILGKAAAMDRELV